jgi:hypothetical protein
LQRQWKEDIEALERRLMHAVARFAYSGERAEEESYELANRLGRLERHIRALAETREKAGIVDLPNWRRHRRDAA